MVRVVRSLGDDNPTFSDCQIDQQTRQCEMLSTLLEFSSPASDSLMHLTLYLHGRNIFYVIPDNQGAFTPYLFRYDDGKKTWDNAYTEDFVIAFSENLSYDGDTYTAVEATFKGQRTYSGTRALPPKRFIIAKDRGVLEWEDFAGNVYRLVQ